MKPCIVLLSLLLLFSCAQKQTKLILLPQDDGATGAVTMSTQDGQAVTLDKPYTVSQSGSMTVAEADPEAIQKEYGDLFKMELKRPIQKPAAPKEEPPQKFTLFFESNTLVLTAESQKELVRIQSLLKKIPPTRIKILGFTDTVGTEESNLTLASRRADHIAKLLNQHDKYTNRIEIRGYGEHGLMVTTPDNTPEPKNRRVKIYIYASH